MTVEQFDKIIDKLIEILLPPNISNDDVITAEQVLDVLERHCEALRNMRRREAGPNLENERQKIA
jgi:hypothetical protein